MPCDQALGDSSEEKLPEISKRNWLSGGWPSAVTSWVKRERERERCTAKTDCKMLYAQYEIIHDSIIILIKMFPKKVTLSGGPSY